jgi:flavin-dependent dehydrogenase
VFDAAIIGGGPAGATAGRLLAQWGHSVTILAASPSRNAGLAECLPPSNRKLFHFLDIQEAIDRAGFFPTTGNTVWWGKKRRRTEPYPDGTGYQVRRADFDRLLLELAGAAGAQVQVGKAFHVPDADGARVEFQTDADRAALPARFILDCSGRAGVIGRSVRVKEKNSRTVALCGIWRSERGWKLPDASHTLVEAYSDGWACSVPRM